MYEPLTFSSDVLAMTEEELKEIEDQQEETINEKVKKILAAQDEQDAALMELAELLTGLQGGEEA